MSAPRAGTTRFSIRNNSRVAYDPGAIPAGSETGYDCVIMLHDLLADRGAFAAQRAALGGGLRVVAADARGHGASATLANQWYTVAELAQDVIGILDGGEIASAHVVGHGLGGVTALELAHRYPERVRSLVLVEPSAYALLDNDPEPAAAGLRANLRASDRSAADAAYKGLVDKSLEAYVSPRWGAGWRDTASKARAGAVRRHASALAGLLPALDSFTVTRGELRNLRLPTLIVAGDDAGPIDRVTAARLAELIPGASFVTLPLGPRENAPFSGDAAAALNDALLRFFASNAN